MKHFKIFLAVLLLILQSIIFAQLPVQPKKIDGRFVPLTLQGDTIRYTYTYDINGNLLTETDERQQNNVWSNFTRWSYTYDPNGNYLSMLVEQWQNSTWVNYQLQTNVYNLSGDISFSTSQAWQNGMWTDVSRTTYTYEAGGQSITAISETWSNNVWVNSVKSFYTLDVNGYKLSWLKQIWSNNVWVNQSLYTYSVRSSGKLTAVTYAVWSNNAWLNSTRNSFVYDDNEHLITQLSESWQNNGWVNSGQYSYSYDNSWGILEVLYERWTGGSLSQYAKYSFVNDSFGNALSGQRWLKVNDNWQLSSGSLPMYYNQGNNSKSIYTSSATATFQFIPTSVETDDTGLMKFALRQNFPNPFNPSTKIYYSTPKVANVKLTVYDLLGNELAVLVNEEKIPGNYTVNFNAGTNPSGIYMYKLECGNLTQVRKMILLK